jgi:hypothetical protein
MVYTAACEHFTSAFLCSTTNMLAQRRLPDDIVELIVQQLVSETGRRYELVRAASLVSRAWRRPCQLWLFSRCTFHFSQGQTAEMDNSLRLMELLGSHVELAGFVRELHVSATPLSGSISPDPAGSSTHRIDSMLLNLCSILPKIVIFHLCSPVDGSTDVLEQLLSRWQGLEHLEVNCRTPISTPFRDATRSYTNMMALRLTVIDICTVSAAFMVALLTHLGRTVTRQTLRSARLYLYCEGYNTDQAAEASRMAEMLHAVNVFSGLRELELDLIAEHAHKWTSHVTNVLGM